VDNVIAALVADDVQLEQLEISGCSSLTNAGLQALLGLPGLRRLVLTACEDPWDRLSYRGVKGLLKHPGLQELQLQDTGCVIVWDGPPDEDPAARLRLLSSQPGLMFVVDES
jgi:hypothetical protein